jgi:1-acyl-sn-glycerol-3-phosphate acyltransferase
LQIHEPIPPIGKGNDNVQHALKTSYDAIMGGIVPKYQGFVENPDQ